jgi:hypothetical protein
LLNYIVISCPFGVTKGYLVALAQLKSVKVLGALRKNPERNNPERKNPERKNPDSGTFNM